MARVNEFFLFFLSDCTVGARSLAYFLAPWILILLSAYHLCKCLHKRLWLFPCYPTRLTALNAATLALLTIAIKLPDFFVMDRLDEDALIFAQGAWYACALIWAYLPSIASMDLSQMWTNFAGTVLLLMMIFFNTTSYYYDESFSLPAKLGLEILAYLAFFMLVLMVQAISMHESKSEVAACVSMRLQELHAETRRALLVSGADEKHVMYWSWDAMERTTYIKLMMALTSNLQNVASRSPSSAIFLALILPPIVPMLAREHRLSRSSVNVRILPIGFICACRWLRLAMCDDQQLPLLLFHSCKLKITKFLPHLKAVRPHRILHLTIWQSMVYIVKSTIYWALAFITFFFIGPLYWLLLILISSIHALSTLFVQVLIKCSHPLVSWLNSLTKFKALFSQIRSKLTRCSPTVQSMPPEVDDLLMTGVIYISGEAQGIVYKLFEGSARLVIERCIKKAEAKPISKALETILKLSNQACYFKANGVFEVVDKRGAPQSAATPHIVGISYGDQYGWSLTIVSLLNVLSTLELQVLGTFETTMAAMDAYEQAKEMVAMVDEMHAPVVCTREVYLESSKSLWLSLLNKRRSWKKAASCVQEIDPIDVILDKHLKTRKRQLEKHSHVLPWRMEVVRANTMYTVCHNLQKWWMDVGRNATKDNVNYKCLTNHIRYLIAEVLAGCLCSLPVVFETRMSNAVCNGHVDEIGTGIFLIHRAKELWRKLQWPFYYNGEVPDVSVVGFSLRDYWLRHPQVHRQLTWPRHAHSTSTYSQITEVVE